MLDKDVPPRPSPYLRPVPPAARLARSTVSLLIGVGFVLILATTLFGPNGLGEYLSLKKQRDELQQQEATLRAASARMEADLEALRTEPFALEKLARERYNMRRPEEQVILLVPDPDPRLDTP